jgi:hypothetical protein
MSACLPKRYSEHVEPVIRRLELAVVIAAPPRAQRPLGLVLQVCPRGVRDLGVATLAGDADEIVGLVVAQPYRAEVPFDLPRSKRSDSGTSPEPHETRTGPTGLGASS